MSPKPRPMETRTRSLSERSPASSAQVRWMAMAASAASFGE